MARVKRTQGHVVDRPFCLARGSSVREARELARRHNVTGLLIEEAPGSGVLAGLLSNRDWPWSAAQDDRPVEEFMTPVARLVTGPPDISIEEAERRMFARRVEKLPLVDGDRRIRGLITKKDILAARQRPYSSKDARGRLLVGAAIGARGDFLERAAELLGAGADALLIDIAHGHSEVMRRAVEAVRARFSGVELVCGNVATAEGAAFLRDLGADAIKVGVGPGRGCRTRLETGAGVPQLQAIREAWCAVEDTVPIIADGGVREDKDVFLALVAGASVVMLGSLLSGTDEAPGQIIEDPGTGEKRKIYRGMTSPQAVFRALYDDEEPDARRDRPRDAGRGPGDAGAVPRLGGGHPPADPRASALRRQLRRGGVARPAPREGPAGPPPLPGPALVGLARRILRALTWGQTLTSGQRRPMRNGRSIESLNAGARDRLRGACKA